MSAGGQGRDLCLLHVHWKGAEALDGIHKEQDAPVGADFSQPIEVHPVAAEELYEADGHHPSARRQCPDQRLEIESSLLFPHQNESNTFPFLNLPGVVVRWKFDLQRYNLAA